MDDCPWAPGTGTRGVAGRARSFAINGRGLASCCAGLGGLHRSSARAVAQRGDAGGDTETGCVDARGGDGLAGVPHAFRETASGGKSDRGAGDTSIASTDEAAAGDGHRWHVQPVGTAHGKQGAREGRCGRNAHSQARPG